MPARMVGPGSGSPRAHRTARRPGPAVSRIGAALGKAGPAAAAPVAAGLAAAAPVAAVPVAAGPAAAALVAAVPAAAGPAAAAPVAAVPAAAGPAAAAPVAAVRKGTARAPVGGACRYRHGAVAERPRPRLGAVVSVAPGRRPAVGPTGPLMTAAYRPVATSARACSGEGGDRSPVVSRPTGRARGAARRRSPESRSPESRSPEPHSRESGSPESRSPERRSPEPHPRCVTHPVGQRCHVAWTRSTRLACRKAKDRPGRGDRVAESARTRRAEATCRCGSPAPANRPPSRSGRPTPASGARVRRGGQPGQAYGRARSSRSALAGVPCRSSRSIQADVRCRSIRRFQAGAAGSARNPACRRRAEGRPHRPASQPSADTSPAPVPRPWPWTRSPDPGTQLILPNQLPGRG